MSSIASHIDTDAVAEPAASATADRIVGKVIWRLLPFMALLYFVNQLDRVNISFAALTMNQDLGFTAQMYGFGAGIFFVGYFIFEIPSNLLLHRFGARLWIFRIMLTWGAVSVAMAWVNSPQAFYVMRFLLGFAEAGFVPGMFLYLTYWIPKAYRGKALGLFIIAAPATPVLAGPISTLLLEMDGLLGLRGWQWMFILEGLPAIVLAFVTLSYLTDRPANAQWLTAQERTWLEDTIAAEEKVVAQHGSDSLWDGLRSLKVMTLTICYLMLVIGTLGVAFFLPQIIRTFGLGNLAVGFVIAIPYGLAAAACILWPRRSDRKRERRWHLALACFAGAGGLAVAASIGTHWLAILPLCVALMGVYAALPVFWCIPGNYLIGLAAASGIALINSIGNLGGFIGPFLVGWLRDLTGSFNTALLCLSIGPLVAGLIILAMPGEIDKSAK
ncbi:MFS transporter [Bosea psychrotolerans]|uniref:ACS family tartrate transporter-like MFS transporter n=1 Tax=Bosea psychrotolerans TaxID=1871628 RepID=A0A2S4MB31_9HYPH|nr:MFS transporter [Bosea psychrotolerans]POR51943.1 ACS family tartrate transporter-like MFS transporter [Bosea psychrotolerans]